MTSDQALRRLADELFITTDAKEWEALLALFVEGEIEVDMSSLVGGGPVRLTAESLVQGFRNGAWRLDGFRYYSKLTRGNDAVRTHQA